MKPIKWYYGLLLCSYFSIIGILLAWYGWGAPPKLLSPAWTITLLVLPLFAPLRGLLHARPYTVAWSLFLSLFYLTHGIIEAYSTPPARLFAFSEIAAACCWLIAGVLYVRASRASK